MNRSLGLLGILAVSTAWGQEQPGTKWSERFPDVAARIRRLDQRLNSKEELIRQKVLTELTYFQSRQSKVYPPFFRALLKDASADVRGEAVHKLWEHGVFLTRKELPESFKVHFVGEFRWQQPMELDRVRLMAQDQDSKGGWAIHALGIVGDADSAPLARNLLASKNVFTRFSAAVALIQLGEKKDGINALTLIRRAQDDVTGYYRYRSAEVLYRLGDRDAIVTLIDEMDSNMKGGYASGPLEILEDLTGEYFLTAAEWRKWWETQKEKKP